MEYKLFVWAAHIMEEFKVIKLQRVCFQSTN